MHDEFLRKGDSCMAHFQIPAGIHTQTIASPGTTVYYPLVFGLKNHSAENVINRMIHQTVSLLQREQMKVQTGTNMEMTGHYEIKTNERGILSLLLSNYAYSTPMAHGFTVAKSLTFDVNTAKLYRLDDLFKPGSGYAAVISGLVSEQVKQRDMPMLHGSPTVGPKQDYYLADKALVVYYQLYGISPYYVGFPMFPISVYELQSIVAESGPLDTLAADIA
jgi:hypothetical protein